MFSSKRIDNQKALDATNDEIDVDTESGYLLGDDEYLEKLARSLFTASHLPENDAYVGIIGHGYEKSNLEAIFTLLTNHNDRLCELPGNQHLEKGLELLESRFSDVERFLSY